MRPFSWIQEHASLSNNERAAVLIVAGILLTYDVMTFPQVARNSAIAAAGSATSLPAAPIALAPAPASPPAVRYDDPNVAIADPYHQRLVSVATAPPQQPKNNVVVARNDGGGDDRQRMGDLTAIVDLGHGSSSALLRVAPNQSVIVHVGDTVGKHRVASIDVANGVRLDDGSTVPAAGAADQAPIAEAPDADPSPSPGPTITPHVAQPPGAATQLNGANTPPQTQTPLSPALYNYMRRAGTLPNTGGNP